MIPIILGDFNACAYAACLDDPAVFIDNNYVKSLLNLLHVLDGYRLNQIRNGNDRIIDLVICNITHGMVERYFAPLAKEDIHHPALHISISIKSTSSDHGKNSFPVSNNNSRYNFRKANF